MWDFFSELATKLYPSDNAPIAETDFASTLTQSASDQYKFLANHDIITIVNLKDNEGYAETWPADEPGDPSWPRPETIPMGKAGVEIKRKDFNANDYAAEVFSHVDQKGISYANKLVESLSPAQLDILKQQSADYDMSKKLGMSEELAVRNAGMSALRGFVFGQWPKEAIDHLGLNKSQTKMLEDAQRYAIHGEE